MSLLTEARLSEVLQHVLAFLVPPAFHQSCRESLAAMVRSVPSKSTVHRSQLALDMSYLCLYKAMWVAQWALASFA